ncbi:MAG: hypothetical protein V7L26_21775 [Nostoc sp.]
MHKVNSLDSDPNQVKKKLFLVPSPGAPFLSDFGAASRGGMAQPVDVVN